MTAQSSLPVLATSLASQLSALMTNESIDLASLGLTQECCLLLDALKAITEESISALSRHDQLNAYTSACGYAELLTEELCALDQTVGFCEAAALLIKSIRAYSELPASDLRRSNLTHYTSNTTLTGVILAVDDHAENTELLKSVLGRSGHTVHAAHNGRDALKQLETIAVDIVLLDLSMPEIDGKTVLTTLKADPALRSIPVIVISGEQDVNSVLECIELGADDYLFKPFNSVLLQARIKAGIERKRWHDKESLYLNQLEQREAFIRATFGRYLTDDIVADILEKPEGLKLGGDLREVSILMADIRGFTQLCSELEPEQVVTLLNEYLGTMTDIIMSHRGTIDEFLGDAILAVFGAPKADETHADNAVHCAIAMQRAVAAVNASNQKRQLPNITTGIAINTGRVVAGNIGSDRRAKYGFVGSPMNVTARIEDLCGPNELLVAETTKDALTQRFKLEARGAHSLKGIEHPISIFAIDWLEAGQ